MPAQTLDDVKRLLGIGDLSEVQKPNNWYYDLVITFGTTVAAAATGSAKALMPPGSLLAVSQIIPVFRDAATGMAGPPDPSPTAASSTAVINAMILAAFRTTGVLWSSDPLPLSTWARDLYLVDQPVIGPGQEVICDIANNHAALGVRGYVVLRGRRFGL